MSQPFALDVKLTPTSGAAIPLRIIQDADGVPQYEEEEQIGQDVPNPQDCIQFVDVFDSWHKGGFVKEFVQNGYYFMAENVCCIVPGEIKPAPKRLTALNLHAGAAGIDDYGPAALGFDPELEYFLVVGREEAAAANNRPNQLRLYAVNSSHARVAGDGDILTSDARDEVSILSISRVRMERVYTGGSARWLIPIGTPSGYVLYNVSSLAVAATVAKSALGVVKGAGRLYIVHAATNTGMMLSNADINADLTAAASWTTPVSLYSDGLGPRTPFTWSLGQIDGVPFIGLANGIHALGPNGIPYNLSAQFEFLPSPGNHAVMRTISQGRLATSLGGTGEIRAFNRSGSLRYGPGVENLLSTLPKEVQIQDMYESPDGSLWVFVWYPQFFTDAFAEGQTWQMWVGVPNPQGGCAWHPLWTDINSEEGRSQRSDLQPFLPIPWSTPEVAIPIESGADTQKILFLHGGLFFNGKRNYQAEDDSIGYTATVPVKWRSGMYFRRDPRVKRHWTKVRFRSKNAGGVGAAGGRIKVEVSYGAGFTTLGHITFSPQTFTLNAVDYGLEFRLTWELDGLNANTMRDTPATVTQIDLYGRELPAALRKITCLVDPNEAAKAGGTRRKQSVEDIWKVFYGSSALGQLNVTFTDPFRTDRTVQLLTGTGKLSLAECRRFKVPDGTIRLVMLETVEPV